MISNHFLTVIEPIECNRGPNLPLHLFRAFLHELKGYYQYTDITVILLLFSLHALTIKSVGFPINCVFLIMEGLE